MEGIKALAIIAGILLFPYLLVQVIRKITIQGGEAFAAAHPGASKLYATELASGQKLMFKLPKRFNGKYAYFSDEKGAGVILIPDFSYDFSVIWEERSKGFLTTTSANYDDFVPVAGVSYYSSYDDANKEFSLEEGYPDLIG